ncbi:MAG: Uma2 family endonuclease [Pseudomonadota bacterium]
MSQPARKPATYADLFELPDTVVGQIVHGVLHAHPRPASPHARASAVLGTDLSAPFDRGRGGPGGWWILDEPELHLGPHVLVPDLAGWRRERMPQIPDVAYFELPPDWICEVLSPSTARLDRVDKLPIYAQFEVRWVWLVDPAAHTLEVFGLDRGHWRLEASFAEDARVAAPPFEAVTLELDALWIGPAAQG